MTSAKKVLLVVIDALAEDVIRPAIDAGKLPTFAALEAAGESSTTTAIFPSITPAATASIATGVYPVDHGIAGAYWWDEERNTVAFFGSDLWLILNEGPGKYFRDFMVSLNERHLKADPIFESIEREGKTAAVINYMWFRGACTHEVNAPLLLELLSGGSIPDVVRGPTHLGLADFVPLNLSHAEAAFNPSGGINQRYGFHDDCTAASLHKLFSAGVEDIPDFTLAYFPNNDFESHDEGPGDALPSVQKVDQHLAELCEQFGGVESFLQHFAVVVCGDHSQSVTDSDDQVRDIVLDELLGSFRQVKAGQTWGDADQILICTNLRAAQIYVHSELPDVRLRHLVDDLLAENRIDQVIIRSGDAFEVLTADRGSCCFQKCEEGGTRDEYGNHWNIVGDLRAVDASEEDGRLSYGDYPNALERVATGFSGPSASLWVTARPGHEFRIAETHTHPGGSHGSLHRLDSTSTFIAAGLPAGLTLPPNPRTVDIAPLCRAVLFHS